MRKISNLLVSASLLSSFALTAVKAEEIKKIEEAAIHTTETVEETGSENGS